MAKTPTKSDQVTAEYLVVTPLRIDPDAQEALAPGEVVTLPKSEGDALVSYGAVTEIRARPAA